MLSERRTRAFRDIANRAGSAESVETACATIAKTLADYAADVPFVKIYSYASATDSLQLLGDSVLDARTCAAVDSGAGDFPGVATGDANPWPFRDVLAAGKGTLVLDVLARAGAIPCADYGQMTSSAFVVPIESQVPGVKFGFAVIGLSTRLAFDAVYQSFVEMLGEAIGVAVGTALAYQAERQRADELAALDKAKTAYFSNVSHEFRTR